MKIRNKTLCFLFLNNKNMGNYFYIQSILNTDFCIHFKDSVSMIIEQFHLIKNQNWFIWIFGKFFFAPIFIKYTQLKPSFNFQLNLYHIFCFLNYVHRFLNWIVCFRYKDWIESGVFCFEIKKNFFSIFLSNKKLFLRLGLQRRKLKLNQTWKKWQKIYVNSIKKSFKTLIY